MTFDGTLYTTYSSVWKIRVSPNGVKEEEPQELFRVWMPDGTKDNHKRWVFYNPKIALVIAHRFDKNSKYYVPMSMFYALKDALKVMFNRIASKDMYAKVDGQLYLSEQKKIENKVKLTMFSDSVVFTPVVIEYENDDGLVQKRGVRIESIQNAEKTPIDLDINELKTSYEVLDRLDINTYSLILSLAEQLGEMDQKIDKVIDLQTRILKLIEKESMQDFKDKFTVDWGESS